MPQPGVPTVAEPRRNGTRKRLSSNDWVVAALEHIAESGVTKLAIEPLARRLGVTKGSFYWHFRSRDALLDAVLVRWHQRAAELIADLAAVADPRERLRQLFKRVSEEMQTLRVHAALLKAIETPRVQQAVKAAAEQHLALVAEAYREIGQAPDAALNSARLAYAAYLGFMQINLVFEHEAMNHDEYDRYVDHLVDTLVP